MPQSAPEAIDCDLLGRVKAIAAWLGLTEKTAQHRIDKSEIPTFRIGGTICARRAILQALIDAKAVRP